MRLQGPLLAAALGGVVAYLATQTFPKPRNFVKVTDNLYRCAMWGRIEGRRCSPPPPPRQCR